MLFEHCLVVSAEWLIAESCFVVNCYQSHVLPDLLQHH